jgi:signal transduction histidine kinase/CheY-like chemotaxis protein
MRPFESPASRPLLATIAGITAAVFVADYFTPLGIIVWVFYLIPIILCASGRNPDLPIVVAGAATLGIAVSLLTDAPGVSRGVAFTNRALGVTVLVTAAVLVRQIVEARLASAREDWLRRVHAGMLDRLQGDLGVAEVGERVLVMLGEALTVTVGAFYHAVGGEARLAASVALAPASAPETFRAGEGVVGQALKDGRVVVVDPVPDDAFRVEAGVAAMAPRHLTVVPVAAEGRPVAILALGGTRPFDELALALFARLSEPLAVAIRTADYRGRLNDLLAETQRQSEELQAQQEELRVSNEELESQSRMLRESQGRLEAQQAELEQTNAHLEAQGLELERQRDAFRAAKQAADRANATKSEFLANMSHELRTPLNSALILARLLADNRGGNLTDEQIRYAETIYSAGNDLLALINDILDLSKIEAGGIQTEVEPVPPERLATELRPVFEPIAREKGLSFVIDLAPGLPETIRTDGHRVRQILTNLLSNACKFTERGEVTLTLSRVGPRVAFAVRDTGVGVPAEYLDTIFEPFRQADGTTSRKFGGTGLGLAIARELARLLGGDIEVASVPGRGSTFTLALPIAGPAATTHMAPAPVARAASRPSAPTAPAPPAAVASAAQQPTNGAGRSDVVRRHPGRLVLAIEDDPAFARILTDLVRELDFDCVHATTAREGMALARELAPQGILLDVGLPDGSGLSVLERLKRDPATRHIPVHMISANDLRQTAMELGAVGYALKPVQHEELVEAIRRLEAKLAQRVQRVLVVEDDVRQRESTCALLAAGDVELVGVGSMSDALAELAHASFDCMVLDLALPDGSGYDLLEAMAEGEQYAFPPVIVYTGRELGHDEEQRLRRYSKSIIIKGARSPERLLDEVSLFLHQMESTLPPERQRMLRAARERESAFEGRTVLVVEDDVRNVFALTGLLEPRGAKVEIARNGREAVERLARVPRPDLVLMDIMMPEMDGFEAMRAIRERPELQDLPIIALTAKAMRDDHDRCLAAGANDYVAKPIDVDKLLSLCRVWLPRAA